MVRRFCLLILNANQAARLSGGLLKKTHPNAETRLHPRRRSDPADGALDDGGLVSLCNVNPNVLI